MRYFLLRLYTIKITHLPATTRPKYKLVAVGGDAFLHGQV